MATTGKPPVLVVLQLSGGNDYMNTVIPYNDPLYRDYRPARRPPGRADPAPGRRGRAAPEYGPPAGDV